MLTNQKRLTSSLNRIGHADATSQDPADNAAHEFSVAAFLRSYSESRYDQAKAALLTTVGEVGQEKIATTKEQVRKLGVTANIVLALAKSHIITAQVKRGASYLDETSLLEELSDMIGLDEAKKLLHKHRKGRDASVTYIVTENNDT